MGVVTEVHSQGSCGACWAITAVETIESSLAIVSGTLLDLSEEEVIACDGTCEMCNGGWPQNAYDYVMKVCTPLRHILLHTIVVMTILDYNSHELTSHDRQSTGVSQKSGTIMTGIGYTL